MGQTEIGECCVEINNAAQWNQLKHRLRNKDSNCLMCKAIADTQQQTFYMVKSEETMGMQKWLTNQMKTEDWKNADGDRKLLKMINHLSTREMKQEVKELSWFGGVRMTKPEVKEMIDNRMRYPQFLDIPDHSRGRGEWDHGLQAGLQVHQGSRECILRELPQEQGRQGQEQRRDHYRRGLGDVEVQLGHQWQHPGGHHGICDRLQPQEGSRDAGHPEGPPGHGGHSGVWHPEPRDGGGDRGDRAGGRGTGRAHQPTLQDDGPVDPEAHGLLQPHHEDRKHEVGTEDDAEDPRDGDRPDRADEGGEELHGRRAQLHEGQHLRHEGQAQEDRQEGGNNEVQGPLRGGQARRHRVHERRGSRAEGCHEEQHDNRAGEQDQALVDRVPDHDDRCEERFRQEADGRIRKEAPEEPRGLKQEAVRSQHRRPAGEDPWEGGHPRPEDFQLLQVVSMEHAEEAPRRRVGVGGGHRRPVLGGSHGDHEQQGALPQLHDQAPTRTERDTATALQEVGSPGRSTTKEETEARREHGEARAPRGIQMAKEAAWAGRSHGRTRATEQTGELQCNMH
eukprot:12510256-Heterocapsa_arctica.AAC.1